MRAIRFLPSAIVRNHGGGGGIFLACEDLGRMFDNSFPACAFFFFLLLLLFVCF